MNPVQLYRLCPQCGPNGYPAPHGGDSASAAAQGLGPEAAFKFITDGLKQIFATELQRHGATLPAGVDKTKEGKQAAEELASAIAQLAQRGLDQTKVEGDKRDAAGRKTALAEHDAKEGTRMKDRTGAYGD